MVSSASAILALSLNVAVHNCWRGVARGLRRSALLLPLDPAGIQQLHPHVAALVGLSISSAQAIKSNAYGQCERARWGSRALEEATMGRTDPLTKSSVACASGIFITP